MVTQFMWRRDFVSDISQENSEDSYLCMFSTHFASFIVLFFFLYWSPSYSLCTVIDAASYKIDEVLSITPSAKVFVLRNLNVYHKGWLTYSGGTDDLVNSPINFLFQTT